jgi:hypothetical protein
MKFLKATIAATAIVCAASPAFAGKPDDGYYSLYEDVMGDGSFVDMSVCTTGGCDFGFTGSFEHVCAILETVPVVADNVMTRDIFVLDKRNSSSNPMTLTVYHRVDTATGGGDNWDVTLTHTISLDIVGGPKAKCKMVENPKYVYLGTDLSSHAVRIDKKKFKTSEGASGSTTLLSVDSRGYVTISDTGSGGFELLDPKGVPVVSGGGGPYEVGDQTATLLN